MTKIRIKRKDSSTKKHNSPVKATVLRASRSDSRPGRVPGSTTVIAGGLNIIEPPYPTDDIHELYDTSNIIPQCVTTYITNITRYGYRVVQRDSSTPIQAKEKKMLESFIEHANATESLATLMSNTVYNYEKYGYSFIEVLRTLSGSISILRHKKSKSIKLIRLSSEDESIPVTVDVPRGSKSIRVTVTKKFRRYVESRGSDMVYYKEFGDPRKMDSSNGRYESDEYQVPASRLATELLHHRQYSEDEYGTPRWIAQSPNVVGSREAEEVNMNYFKDNTVPPAILSVAGGRLTHESFKALKQLVETSSVGKDRQNKILLIEAIPETNSVADDGSSNVRLQIDKLTDSRQSDAVFSGYSKDSIDKIRSTFRIPPVLVGMSQDVNFATATTSSAVAETQVFEPERSIHDEFINLKFVNNVDGLDLKTVKLESKGPNVTNPDQVVKTITAINVMGGVTPRAAINIVNETMQLSIPQYPEKGEEGWEEWMDRPISLSLRMAGTQQTGKGDDVGENTEMKNNKIKETENEGETGFPSLAVENGSQ